jgi:hypothetical protein
MLHCNCCVNVIDTSKIFAIQSERNFYHICQGADTKFFRVRPNS